MVFDAFLGLKRTRIAVKQHSLEVEESAASAPRILRTLAQSHTGDDGSCSLTMSKIELKHSMAASVRVRLYCLSGESRVPWN